jgi:hypothetical protein
MPLNGITSGRRYDCSTSSNNSLDLVKTQDNLKNRVLIIYFFVCELKRKLEEEIEVEFHWDTIE